MGYLAKKVEELEKREVAPEVPVQKQPKSNINLTQEKLQYIKSHDFIEFDKEELRKELEAEHVWNSEIIENLISTNQYFRLMSDGKKMFYSVEYLNSHSIQEIEAAFAKMN